MKAVIIGAIIADIAAINATITVTSIFKIITSFPQLISWDLYDIQAIG